MSVGRNDPCPCGSGKKYKKCCMNNVVSLDHVIGSELDQLQQELFSFAYYNFETEINEVIDDLIGVEMEEDEGELLNFLMMMWAVFHLEINSSMTMIEGFIQEKEKKKSIRTSVLQQLKKWKKTSPSFSIVSNIIDDSWIEVEDFFSKERKKVRLNDDQLQFEQNGMLFGFMLPYGNYYSYLAFFLDFPADEVKILAPMIQENFEQSEFLEPSTYMTQAFPTYVKLFVLGQDELGPIEFRWDNPLYEKVATLYEQTMEELIGLPDDLIETGKMLWSVYCDKINPSFRKPEVYAAALHYFVDLKLPFLQLYTQKELAEIYGVSVTSVSQAYQQIAVGLQEEIEMLDDYIDEMMEGEDNFDFNDEDDLPFDTMMLEKTMREASDAMQGQEFDSIEEANLFVNKFINQQDRRDKSELSSQERAQELIYEAFQAPFSKRKKLVNQALKLDPNNVDAYNILGDIEANLNKARQFYLKGMEVGEKELGKKFFKDNQGMFWGLIETRPYMRAKYNYALTLVNLGKEVDAMKHLEDLLQLNESDNQGARYNLFSVYVNMGKYHVAKELLDKYPEDFTANGAYNNVLIEYLQNGITPKLDKLLKKARKVNPHVIDYIVGNKRIPNHFPASYQLGDKDEAITYALEFLDLWEDKTELVEWLKRSK